MIEPGQAPPGGEELRSTKNVQIIDAAANRTYHIYAFTDEQFALLFPEESQNIEFIEDAILTTAELRSSLSYEPYDGHLCRLVRPLVAAMTSAHGWHMSASTP